MRCTNALGSLIRLKLSILMRVEFHLIEFTVGHCERLSLCKIVILSNFCRVLREISIVSLSCQLSLPAEKLTSQLLSFLESNLTTATLMEKLRLFNPCFPIVIFISETLLALTQKSSMTGLNNSSLRHSHYVSQYRLSLWSFCWMDTMHICSSRRFIYSAKQDFCCGNASPYVPYTAAPRCICLFII